VLIFFKTNLLITNMFHKVVLNNDKGM